MRPIPLQPTTCFCNGAVTSCNKVLSSFNVWFRGTGRGFEKAPLQKHKRWWPFIGKMRLYITILILTIMSCSQRVSYLRDYQSHCEVEIPSYNPFGDISDGLPDIDSTVTFLDNKGKRIEEGRCAVSDWVVSNIKVGLWREYHDNGKVKSQGDYRISSYEDCCLDRPCTVFYHYRFGIWRYFDSKGDLDYELEFKPEKLWTTTKCQRIDTLVFGLVKNIPTLYLEKITDDMVFELQKIIYRDTLGTISYTPDNGQLVINRNKDK